MTRYRNRLRSLTVRGRTLTVFALVAVTLSSVTAVTVWFSVSEYLLGLRQSSATAQAIEHAEQLESTLPTGQQSPATQLGLLPRTIGSVSLLGMNGQGEADRWFTTSLEVGQRALPSELKDAVAAGQPALQRLEVSGQPMLAVGLPMPGQGVRYFELFPLAELEETFTVLSAVLVASVLVLPLGTVLLGRWALSPALRPFDRVAAVAQAVAAGNLSARLDPAGDPALIPIATSFNQTADALERRVRVDAQFAADVSHELRTPLTAMIGAVSVLADHRPSLPAPAAEMVSLLEHEVARFARLVEDLLEISRLDAGSAELSLDDVDLAEFVRRTVLPGRSHVVQVADTAQTLVVTVDRRRLERVLANLFNNAEQHGEGLTRVIVDADGLHGVVVVEDNGPGLNEDELDHVFDRFARSRRSSRGSTAGAGLGLSLVARHLQLMGGSVTAENRAEGGSRFVVKVPASSIAGRRE